MTTMTSFSPNKTGELRVINPIPIVVGHSDEPMTQQARLDAILTLVSANDGHTFSELKVRLANFAPNYDLNQLKEDLSHLMQQALLMQDADGIFRRV